MRENGSERIHAALILNDPSANPEDLIRRANQRLEAHQRIQGWSLWPEEDFPRTPSTLKVKRHEIARRLAGGPKQAEPQHRGVDLSALSSLERVELLSELEDRYQIELDEEVFATLTTSRELEEWIRTPEVAAAAPERESAPSDWARSAPVRAFRTVFQHAVAVPLFRHYLPLTVEGGENLRGLKPPVIFAANHTSHLDVPAIFTALPHQWRQRLAPAMMKDHFRAYFEPQLHSWKEIVPAALTYFLACSIYNTYPLPQRMAGTRRALQYTGKLISRGFCPIVFPEGLRTSNGEVHTFRPGIGIMAVRLKVPVVPIRLSGLYDIFPPGSPWPKRGPVRVAIGAPISFSANTPYEEVARRALGLEVSHQEEVVSQKVKVAFLQAGETSLELLEGKELPGLKALQR